MHINAQTHTTTHAMIFILINIKLQQQQKCIYQLYLYKRTQPYNIKKINNFFKLVTNISKKSAFAFVTFD